MDNVVTKSIVGNVISGEVKMKNIDGEIKFKSSSGSVSIQKNKMDSGMDIETGSGSITLEMKEEPTNATFDLKTSSGFVSKWKDNTVFGNGLALIKLHAGSGDIKVKR